MRYKAVLFDMDGTVLDTLTDLQNAVNETLRRFGLPEVSREKVSASLGNGAAHLLRCCLPGQPEERVREALAWYLPWYEAHCSVETRPYPGVLPLMERLRGAGVKLAIISNKGDAAVQELAEGFFPDLLETAVGESAAVRRKPNPDAVLAAAAQMGLAVEDCVYVGDTEVDLATAKNAGMDCIAVTWGFRSEAQLAVCGAARIARDPGELAALLGLE